MTKKSMHRDMLIYLPSKILEGLIGIIIISIYSKLLSPDEYGRFSLLNPLILVTFTLVSGWVYHSAYRFNNDSSYEPDQVISTLGLMLFFTQCVAFFVFIVLKIFNNYDLSIYTILLFYVGYSTYQVLSGVLVSRRYVLQANIISLSVLIFKFAAMFTVYQLGVKNYMAILIGNFISDVLFSIIILSILKLPFNLKKFSFSMVKHFVKYGYPLIGLSFTMIIMSVSDRFVIQYFYSETAVGIYSANYSVASAAFTLLSVGLMRAVYPNVLAHFQKGDLEEVKNLLNQSIRLYMVVAIPAAFGLWMIASSISSVILDKSYTYGSPVIGYVAFGILFLGLSEYASKPFELMRKTNLILYISLVGATINVILNFIFIPIYGYIAASITTSVAYAFHCLLMFYFGSKQMTLHIDLKVVASIIISALAMVFCGSWLIGQVSGKLSLILVVLASAVIYFIGIMIFGTYKHEIQHFKDLLGGRKHASK